MNYVIIGTGPAGVIAAETLRRSDPAGSITLIGDEPEAPYSRMAIPYYLVENIGEEGTHLRHGANHYESLGITLRQQRVTGLSASDKTVSLDDGSSLAYDKLLLATGSHAARPPIPGMDLDGVENCWTLQDARNIAARTKPGDKVVLMGAGFIGLIVLEALVQRQVELTVVEMADRMLPRMMDDVGGEMIKRWCENKGVRVLTSTSVSAIAKDGDGLSLALSNGDRLAATLVVSATGVRPNIDFLAGSGVETDVGILVDHHLETTQPGIYAAGDVAQGPVFASDQREIHAIQPTASEHGRIAALNMAGQPTRYGGSLAMNVLSTLGLISASYGQWAGVDGGEQAVVADPGAFNYLRLEFDGDRLVGALALGLTQHVGVLRGLIQTKVPLGEWKDRLMRNPHLVMEAYLERGQGTTAQA
jgi:NAD(P)H-nitrite reductase large subunit